MRQHCWYCQSRCHETASGYSGPWTPTPTTFNNAYFTILTGLKWIPKDWTGPPQYVDSGSGRLMMLPTDVVLLQDKKFKKFCGCLCEGCYTIQYRFRQGLSNTRGTLDSITVYSSRIVVAAVVKKRRPLPF
jgi:catalase (peroxidase I)